MTSVVGVPPVPVTDPEPDTLPVLRQHPIGRTDVPPGLDERMALAQTLAQAGLLPDHLRGKPANVMLVMLGSWALNIPLFQALQGMHAIDGKLGMSADLMRALVLKHGHKVRTMERASDHAVVGLRFADEDEWITVEYTIQDAVDAGLCTLKDGKPFARSQKGYPLNWEKYPKNMLVARATSTLLRENCSDILMGMVYTPDELGVEVDPIQVTPPLSATTMPVTEAVGWLDVIEAAGTVDELRDLWTGAKSTGDLTALIDGKPLSQHLTERSQQITLAREQQPEPAAYVPDGAFPEQQGRQLCGRVRAKDQHICGWLLGHSGRHDYVPPDAEGIAQATDGTWWEWDTAAPGAEPEGEPCGVKAADGWPCVLPKGHPEEQDHDGIGPTP